MPVVCGICDGAVERRKAIDRLIAGQVTANAIEHRLKALGMPVKGETVRRHMRQCLGSDVRPPQEVLLAATANITRSTNDFAALVRAEAVRKLNNGELKVTTQEGLQAQSLLDRREEKAKDRDLLANLGKLLAGAGLAPPRNVIEGQYEEIEVLSLPETV